MLGFEQAWATPLVALAAAYGTELLLETVDAWAKARRPRFLGSPRMFVEFLLSAHISGLAVGMLLYSNRAILGHCVRRFGGDRQQAIVPGGRAGAEPSRPSQWPIRHFFNPSNFGITLTLLLFPWVGIAPPYQFTENARGVFDVILPLIIVGTGSFLNTKFTERIPLILAWLGGIRPAGAGAQPLSTARRLRAALRR